MVAYSFKASFEAPILAGTKTQTIRNPRKRHARPGDELQLYFGMRTRSCRLIGRSICTSAPQVRLDFAQQLVELDDALTLSGDAELNAFALADGFGGSLAERAGLAPWEHMTRWWALTHNSVEVFPGVLIRWGALL